MIAYHYTTWEAYQSIQNEGLQLSLIETKHIEELQIVKEYLENGCIWLYKNYLTDHKLLGLLMERAVNHSSHKIICLEVTYNENQSAAFLKSQKTYDTIKLTHKLEAGIFGHDKELIDLLITPVLPKNIKFKRFWNLLTLIK